MKWSCSTCETLGDTIDDLKSIIVQLNKKFEDLERSIQANNASNSANNSFNFNMEEVIQEINDRNDRKCNLIIYGLPEASNLNNGDNGSQNSLTAQVEDITRFLAPAIDSSNFVDGPIRLGRYDPSKPNPRPIKVKLSSEKVLISVLRNAKNLRGSRLGHVKISNDRTPKQMEYYRKLKAVLDDRKTKGENNIEIKYIRGVPKIVSSSRNSLNENRPAA